jgi:hypothetical protein
VKFEREKKLYFFFVKEIVCIEIKNCHFLPAAVPQ